MAAGLKIEGFGASGHIVFSLAAFVTSVLLVAPETAMRLAEWCGRPFANILFPSDEFSKPPLSYRLARRYRTEMRHEDAIEQYENIIRHHPREADAYLELLEVAHQMGDGKLQQKYAALFRKRFKRDVPPLEGQDAAPSR